MPGHLIRRIHQISTQLFLLRAREAGFDLTPIQFAALDALAHAPGIDQARLAEAIAKDRATVGAVVDRLEQKGLVARAENSKDRRARILRLTTTGERTLLTLLPVVEGVQSEILSGLSSAESKQVMRLLTKVMANASLDLASQQATEGEERPRVARAAQK
jgi:DNA-binding MarR family transcriptional regulator